MKSRYTDAFWGEHPFDGDMILIKNKNKTYMCSLLSVSDYDTGVGLGRH